jgi:hypothetical protein
MLHASAASRSLALAVDLLLEAAGDTSGWNGAERFAIDVRELAARVAAAQERAADPDDCELVDVERAAIETARLAHTLARACREARIAAVTASILAEGAARIAVEVISEQIPWTPVERLSRQARQLIEIETSRRRVDRAARLVLERGGLAAAEGF